MTMLLSVASAEVQTVKLPACGAEIRKTSVSGLSSGAFMTSQLYLAFSEIMVGASIVASGPYLCAKSWAGNSLLVNATPPACIPRRSRAVRIHRAWPDMRPRWPNTATLRP
ncbi:hypothetical protein ACFSVK_01285 [Azorhizophilus paspali]|uniref:hypothetical protein n=1 Tax=Azorhizophilus paspali TaxID=69963 RepID=UPI0036343702